MESQPAVEPKQWPIEIRAGRELRLDTPAVIRLPKGVKSATIYVQSDRKPTFARDETT